MQIAKGPVDRRRTPMTGKFVLIPPEELTLYRGKTVDLHVAVQREGVDGPIDVAVENLPDGVVASPGHLRAAQTIGRCSLTATSDARIVAGHEARLVATDAEGRETSRMVRLTVTDAAVIP